MKEGPDIAAIAALIGDPGRANMLTALLDGRALTAGELAQEAGVLASTASGHLSRMTEGGLLSVVQQGRHRYYRLSGPEVAHALEGLMTLSQARGSRRRPGPRDPEMRLARTCYDHMAGTLGVQMYDSLRLRGGFVSGPEGLCLSDIGHALLAGLGEPFRVTPGVSRCRECLDWSERRPHLAGPLGKALLIRVVETGWAHRVPGSRLIRFSPDGRAAFDQLFPPVAPEFGSRD
ncbi:ArsR/SmtB family transcription factor [Pseudooceanicola sp. C21-150M6]|uniref:ArsR/SmtB family transcription factor n=1 Tax=Pseudooceanicola sp. C21-150M6 TaxID=3434355 RepID=UPI003D7F9D90